MHERADEPTVYLMADNWREKRNNETQTAYAIRLVREEPLRDLRARLVQAREGLLQIATAQSFRSGEERARLKGKAEGCSLAISYLDEALR